ncbi:hypothetical protein CEXT_748941 [Caerostris extrusa]|uniref:LAGLIDADG homing endonuclease n=1 Tax=Caerostris extrusa TaxID=172846 RepID=A0AAV4QVB6_CAEEX|nr:hypothetical protein CEXT_748941 [Caerostris extrusa]
MKSPTTNTESQALPNNSTLIRCYHPKHISSRDLNIESFGIEGFWGFLKGNSGCLTEMRLHIADKRMTVLRRLLPQQRMKGKNTLKKVIKVEVAAMANEFFLENISHYLR